MSVVMEETGNHPMRYIGKGKMPSRADIREADRVLKKFEKYYGKPISVE